MAEEFTEITCPECGVTVPEQMPVEARQFFYDGRARGAVLRPKPGDCCVFCSCATIPFPPVQDWDGCRG